MSDYRLAPDADNRVTLHRADCPVVRAQADAGKPVMTMFDCQAPLPAWIEKHDCLEEKQ